MSNLSVYKKVAIILLFILMVVFSVGVPERPLDNRIHTESVFVYGTLKSSWVRLFACACRPATKPVVLENYTKEGLNIEPVEGGTVMGYVIYLTKTELEKIDKFENTPTNYVREIIEINGHKYWVYIKK